MTDFIFSHEYHRAVEQWKLTHPNAVTGKPANGGAVAPAPAAPPVIAPSYWDEKKKDRREEFKREDAENRERAYPDREWEHK